MRWTLVIDRPRSGDHVQTTVGGNVEPGWEFDAPDGTRLRVLATTTDTADASEERHVALCEAIDWDRRSQ